MSGSGHIAVRAKFTTLWALMMIVAVPVFVRRDGIRGAAIAHLAVGAPFFVLYLVGGLRRVASESGLLRSATQGIATPVSAQVVVTAAAALGLRLVGLSPAAAGLLAAVIGVATLVAVWGVLGINPVFEVRSIVRSAIEARRERQPTGLAENAV